MFHPPPLNQEIPMKSVLAMIVSAAAIAFGVVIRYVVHADSHGYATPMTGTILIVAGVLTLALSNVCFLTTRNRRGTEIETVPSDERDAASPVLVSGRR
jgi:uncharacterized membrane protein